MHISDVAGLTGSENLQEVVTVGHDYAGLLIEGVTDRVPDRLGRLVSATR